MIGSRPAGSVSPNSTFAIAVAALLARIPRRDHRRRLVQPRHQHRPAGLEHDDVRGFAAATAPISSSWPSAAEVGRIEVLGHPLQPEHDRDVGVAAEAAAALG